MPFAGMDDTAQQSLIDKLDQRLAKRKEQERAYLETIEQTFAQWPNFRLYLQEEDIQGVDALSAFAQELEKSGFSA